MIKIIPVIDIKKGKAVKAYKGEREKYKEIGDVLDIVEKYRANKFEHIYIADIDAIVNINNDKNTDHKFKNFTLIEQIALNNNVNLMVDFGIRTFEEYNIIKERIRNINVNLVVGTETYLSDKFPNGAIVSIDAVDGEILGGNFYNAVKFLKNKNNNSPFITIDLKRIGTSNINLELCARIFKAVGRKFIYGGGVRIKNIPSLRQYCSGVLVGTEIYEKLNL